ncbi:ornithine cyclodeaminase family protein [Alicyclobacillus tolerans]|uniref:ornithine cyclodeaminase family protein n=1 Tax=Alicyclobacillus tolerans TaxID=90970 RepID=UPI001F1F78A3|nr:ornithine cyclodeaminase family protein [Alicyclobacillus tolerans]MCF8565757.1 ornithine cyclodeaminase family protein [Alicyclobacillus tolerans]
MQKILCLSTSDLRTLLSFEDVTKAVERAFVANSLNLGKTYPIIREKLNNDSVFGVKAGLLGSTLGLKAAGYWPQNKVDNGEAHQATILLFDPETGKPRAFIDGNYITTIRTGAAGAIGAANFSPIESSVLAVIGTGVQGKVQTSAVLSVRPSISEVRCCGRSEQSIRGFVEQYRQQVKVTVCDTVTEAVQNADIIVTATPATQPFILASHLKPGVHINAMGSDTKGKSELDDSVLKMADVFVDDLHQSQTIGELQKNPDCVAITIGDVLAGNVSSKKFIESITVFDSTGLALQDLATAELAYLSAIERGMGTWLNW